MAKAVIEDTKARNAAGVALKSVEILNYDLVTTLGLPADTRILPDTTLLDRSLPVEGMDGVELSASHARLDELYGMMQVQSLLESMKEIYGRLLFVAILCLIGLMLRYSGVLPMRVYHNALKMGITLVANSCNKGDSGEKGHFDAPSFHVE